MTDHAIHKFRQERDMPLSEAAKLIGVSTTIVWQWENGTRRVSAERAVEIERITGIPREQLRPDLFQKGPDHAVAST